MQPDYQALMVSESRDLASLLERLSAEQWDAPSLCAGWRVKDVVAHMAVGHTMSVLGFGAAVVRNGFRVNAASYALATSYADTHSGGEILALFREGTAGAPRAAARFVPIRELFTDHLVHHQDIRRPLGLPRLITVDRLEAALTALPTLSSRVGSRRRMAGLRVVATDIDFAYGEQGRPELRGPSEALIMALTGRAEALVELSGGALPLLADRVPLMTTGVLR